MSEVKTENLADELAKPFPAEDIEWRVQRSMKTQNGDKAVVIPYITNRAIMNRLDKIFGPENWKNEYKRWTKEGVLCGISVKVNGEWVTKWDGAEETNIESLKGGLSGSMKRSAVQWGIGRYLYSLDEAWVNVTQQRGKNSNYINDNKTGVKGYWETPQLPKWAVLQEVQFPPQRPQQVQQPTTGTPVTQQSTPSPQNTQQPQQQGQKPPIAADPRNIDELKKLANEIANLQLREKATPEAVTQIIKAIYAKHSVTRSITDEKALEVIVALSEERKAILSGHFQGMDTPV